MKLVRVLPLAALVAAISPASAAVSEEDLDQLRREVAALSLRLDELAVENAMLRQQQKEVKQESKVTLDPPATTADDSGGGTDWYDNIRLDGDFRYRYETIDVEDSPLRRRNRIRARANIRTDVSDDIKVGFGLATGGDDPVSHKSNTGRWRLLQRRCTQFSLCRLVPYRRSAYLRRKIQEPNLSSRQAAAVV